MTTDAVPGPRRRRIVLAVLAVVTVGVGLLVHRVVPGEIGDIAGDALYAVLVFVLVAFILPGRRRSAVAVVAFAVCVAVELFQLTGLPQEWGAAFPPIGLVLGSGFDARDILVYAGGVAAASLADHAITRSRSTAG